MKTPPTNLSPEELERWHYANGDTALAAAHAHARAVDGDANLRADLDYFQAENDRLAGQVDDLAAEIEELKSN
jgi:hypothetical protein